MPEIITDLAYGILFVGIIVATISGVIFFMEAINMTKDSIRIALFVPLFLFFCYHFGGLTRSILNKKS